MRLGLLAVILAILLSGTASAGRTVAIVLNDFRLDPPRVQLTVGEEVTLTIRNEGRVAHEWLIGDGLIRTSEEKGFQKDLFALLAPKLDGRQYSLERVGFRAPGQEEPARRISRGIELQPGGEVRLLFTVPPTAKGEWEMGCLFPGHYESGMKGALVIQ